MNCPACASASNRITGAAEREDPGCVARKRTCLECGHVWETVEIDRDAWVALTGRE